MTIYAIVITTSSKMGSFGVTVSMAVFYGVTMLLAILPCASCGEYRGYCTRLLQAVFWPKGSVSFAEILFADALCSLSKVFKDVGVTVVAIYAMYRQTDVVEYHDSAMIFIAILASLPFL